jgi:serine/threonine protein kinase
MSTIASPGAQLCSPPWLAPELHNLERMTAASDVYAVGIVMWEMLTGLKPWAGLTHKNISRLVINGSRPPWPDSRASSPSAATASASAAAGTAFTLPRRSSSNVPAVPLLIPQELKQLVETCWQNDKLKRPTCTEILVTLRLLQLSYPPDNKQII